MLQCSDCGNTFPESTKTYVELAYCKKCRKAHSGDVLEIVTENEITIYTSTQVQEAENALSKLRAEIRLDLHKTLDTVPPEQSLPPSSCCISYVGQLTQTRVSAREEIQERIASGQLQFGALVFARGSRKNPEAANHFVEVGSKAWFNKWVAGENPIFLDDSEDHVLSVESVGIASYQVNGNLMSILEKALDRDNDSDSDSDSLFG